MHHADALDHAEPIDRAISQLAQATERLPTIVNALEACLYNLDRHRTGDPDGMDLAWIRAQLDCAVWLLSGDESAIRAHLTMLLDYRTAQRDAAYEATRADADEADADC